MTRWFRKRWVWAVFAGSAVAAGANLSAGADAPKTADTMTLKFPGQPDKIVKIVKTARKPDGTVETTVKDGATGETFTLTDGPAPAKAAAAGKATPAAQPATDKVVAAGGKDPLLPRARPRTEDPLAPGTTTPMPETPMERRMFGGKLLGRDRPDAAPGAVPPEADAGEKKPGIFNRLFGPKRTAVKPPLPPAVENPAPPAAPGTRVTTPQGVTGAEPPRSAPSKGLTPPPPPGRTEPVVPPTPAVAVPTPLPPTKPPTAYTPPPATKPIAVPTPMPVQVPTPMPPASVPVPLPAPPASTVPPAPAVPPVGVPVPTPPPGGTPIPLPLPAIPIPGPTGARPVEGGGVQGVAFATPADPGARDIAAFAADLKDSPTPAARAFAAKGLAEGRHGSSDAVKGLLFAAAKSDPAPAVRAQCIEHLCRLGYYDPAFITHLGTACGDPAPDVRAAARVALLKMAPRQW